MEVVAQLNIFQSFSGISYVIFRQNCLLLVIAINRDKCMNHKNLTNVYLSQAIIPNPMLRHSGSGPTELYYFYTQTSSSSLSLGITWVLVYRTEKYKRLKAEVEKQSKKRK